MENTTDKVNAVKPLLRRGLGRPLNHIPAWLKNKYLISFAAFCAIILFFDKNDIFTQINRHNELKELQESKKYYTTQIAAERKESEALKTNPAVVEKIAREKYLMKRDNEELFLVPENHDPAKGGAKN